MNMGSIAAGIAGALLVGERVHAAVTGPSTLLRPPGSQGETDFMSRGIKCGKCVQACPHRVIHVAGLEAGSAAGTPYIDAREGACRMCEDFPCVAACPTQALRDVSSRAQVNMGYAKVDENVCIAFKGYRCEVCYRVCPFIDEAITIENQSIEGDDRHVKFIPVIHKNKCTGCGLCVERCAVDDPRVAIKSVSIAEQQKDGAVF